MSKRGHRVLVVVIAILGLCATTYTGILGWLLVSPSPINHPLASWPLWPVACSIRGCIGSDTWLQYQQAAIHFGTKSGEGEPDITHSLTTAVRAHLVAEAFVRSPVTPADARRYRETVLRLPADSALLSEMGYSAEEYDTVVLLPFLLQEALRQQYRVESTDELYRILQTQRGLWVLPWGLTWNSELAVVERK